MADEREKKDNPREDARERKKTLSKKINFSGKGKSAKRKKQRKKMFSAIAKKLGF